MQDLINPWMIGIGGGVLSGLVVTFISRVIFSQRDNKEYHQKVITANQEILYAIRPSISEEQIPAEGIIGSIRAATAQKYKVEIQDLYKISEIVDSLIKEVMDSSFISMETKVNYCNKLSNLETKEPMVSEISEREFAKVSLGESSYYEYRQKTWTMMSVTIGMMTAAMTMIVYLFSKREYSLSLFSGKMLPLLATMLAGITTVLASTLLMNIRRKYKENKKEEKER